MGVVRLLGLTLTAVLSLANCQSLPTNVSRPTSWAIPDQSESRLFDLLEPRKKNQSADVSGHYPLYLGDDAFVARVALARMADHTLDIQYYIWNSDLTGFILMDEILEAADRGVRVRVLLDDLNLGPYEKTLRILSLHPNVYIRLSNPFANRYFRILDLTRLSDIDRRMHNKVFIADNEAAILGGRNIGNEYFWASKEFNFGDLDLWTIGPVVRDLSSDFDKYWNSETSYPIATVTQGLKVSEDDLYNLRAKLRLEKLKAIDSQYVRALKDTELVRRYSQGELPLFWCPTKAYADPPEKLKHQIHDESQNLNYQLRPYVDSAKKEILMVTPYFVPGANGVDYFRQKVKSGISVIVVTNSLASGDVATVFSGYKKYRKDLIKAGVQLYELRPNVDKEMRKTKSMGSSSSHAGLHGKVMIFDNSTMYVGSMNLDPRSFNLNSEMGVVMKCPELANTFTDKFKNNLAEIAYKVGLDEEDELIWVTYDEGKKTTLHGEPETSWWQRTKASFMSIFVPESKL